MNNISKQQIVKYILDKNLDQQKLNTINTDNTIGQAFAPSNIALIKYWGKANTQINTPNNDSLSISLGSLGSDTKIVIADSLVDTIIVNKMEVNTDTEFYQRIKNYLDLFRNYESQQRHKYFDYYYKIDIKINIPIAAGLASSACGFAALILAFDNLFNLKLSKQDLSILARLGSGSASRSLWDGFVYWQKGEQPDGMDSYAYPLNYIFSDLCIGLLVVSQQQKAISSREAMLNTVNTSVLYNHGWTQQVEQDLKLIHRALEKKDFELLGMTAENNALAMHATMLAAKPSILYSHSDTIDAMNKVWQLRKQGVQVYFTQDAGPNLKLLFTKSDQTKIQNIFPNIQIVQPF